jgi:hypothetical protein
VCPIPRAAEPTPWATASQTAETARKNAWKNRATGPVPLRTARGGGLRLLFLFFFVLRLRVLEPPRPCFLDLVEDVLLLRDPGGEDVRVAMLTTLGCGHTSHTHPTERVLHETRPGGHTEIYSPPMAITPGDVEVVARRATDQFLARDKWEKDVDDRMLRDQVAPLVYDGCRDVMSTLSGSVADDEILVDIRNGCGYATAGLGGVKADVRLLVATNRRLWFCRHRDGAVQQLQPLDYPAMTVNRKRISMGFPKLEGTTVTCGGATAEWLEKLRSGRTQPAPWLQPPQAQPSPGWHPDPYQRHELRYWDGTRWSEHVSNAGTTAVDLVDP